MPHRAPELNALLATTEACFDDALAAGLPAFQMHPRASTPMNATPYMMRYARFRSTARDWPGRSPFLDELDEVLAVARELAISVDMILLGGSFTELEKPVIGDVDCLLFYRQATPATDFDAKALGYLQRNAKERGVDCRFVPLDGDPLVLIKLTSYFTILYSKHKDRHEIVRSLLLLDCRDGLEPDMSVSVATAARRHDR